MLYLHWFFKGQILTYQSFYGEICFSIHIFMLSFDGRLIGLKRFCTWLLDQDMNCELEGQFFQLSQNVS